MFARNATPFTPVSKKFWIRLVESTGSTSVSAVVAESNPARLVKRRKYERGANLAPFFFVFFDYWVKCKTLCNKEPESAVLSAAP
jgi:hypothetical protein